ncbi:cell adhesion molecule DSCAML1-like [Dermacentor albipictus]|uniref:cell adhesion molecule DSCAML1-like n=1 Tax=Dermacentor albipictus TaxID=60249 RepID=UPI0038FC061F
MVELRILVLLCVCWGLTFAWAQKPPKLSPLQLPEGLVAGTDVRLTCSVVVGDTPLEILWYQNEKRLTSLSSVEEETSTHLSTLSFKPLSEDHGGTYKCMARNAAGVDSASVELVVNVAPRWIVEPSDVKAAEGSTIIINCHVKGTPAPRVAWSHDNGGRVTQLYSAPAGENSSGRHKLLSNGTLLIRDVQKSDSGMYTCNVNNGIGLGLKKAVAVTVYTVAQAQVLMQHLSVQSGRTANLTCIATGDHPIVVTWLKGDNSVTANSQLYDRILVSNDTRKERLVSSLILKHVTAGDAGRYTCKVKNDYAEDTKAIRLNVQQPPSNPTEVEVSDVWSRSARIRWKSPSSSSVLSYQVRFWSHRDDEMLNHTVRGGVTTALVRDLHPATEYRVAVVAVNSAGTSESSPIIRFNTTQEEPSGAPVNVRIEKSGATFVLITWSPPPESDWNGKLLGYYVGYSSTSESSRKSPFSYHTVDPDQGSFTLRGLAKATSYVVVVKAFNAVGSGPPSPPLPVTTLDGDFPPAPTLSVSAVDQTSVQVTWMFSVPVPQRITGYTLHYRQPGDSWKEVFVASGKQSSYLLSGLEPSLPCQVYLIAHSRQGNSEPSDVLNVPLTVTSVAQQPGSSASSDVELREVLYVVVPIVTATALAVVLVVSVCFCLYVRKTRQPPPPPAYADFPRDSDFTFAVHGMPPPPGKATPYSTMQRSTDNEGIYESIVDMRTLSLRRKQAAQNSLRKGSVDLVDVCVV